MFVEFHHRALAAAPAVSLARVSLGFGQRVVTERGHDLMRGASGVGHQASECLEQAVWPAIERKPGLNHRGAHPATKAVNGERLAPFPSRCVAEDTATENDGWGESERGAVKRAPSRGDREKIAALYGLLSAAGVKTFAMD